MILDNVDDGAAVAAVETLLPRLKGGHVSSPRGRRISLPPFASSNSPALNEDAAAQFLLDRTEADRSQSEDDAALARDLARELGGLALGLEQAGAHIASERIGFARYLELWNVSATRRLPGPIRS